MCFLPFDCRSSAGRLPDEGALSFSEAPYPSHRDGDLLADLRDLCFDMATMTPKGAGVTGGGWQAFEEGLGVAARALRVVVVDGQRRVLLCPGLYGAVEHREQVKFLRDVDV